MATRNSIKSFLEGGVGKVKKAVSKMTEPIWKQMEKNMNIIQRSRPSNELMNFWRRK